MAKNWGRTGTFAAGIALGAVVAGGVFLVMKSGAGGKQVAVTAAEPARIAASAPAIAARLCNFNPIVSSSAAQDGKFDAGGSSTGDFLIVQGKEAAAAGRDRDAETAFLSACKVASREAGNVVALADAKYQLARHYASLADEGAPNGVELRKRARSLYEESLAGFTAKLGTAHEKTRFASQGLAAVHDNVERPAGPSKPSVAMAAPGAARERETTVAAAPAPRAVEREKEPPLRAVEPETPALSQATGNANAPASTLPMPPQVQPSFDCRKARSVPEKLICSDPELARLDRDLGRLYGRAKSLAPDAAAFERVSEREWRRRESECRDRECLLQWYAQRRDQLQDQVTSGDLPDPVQRGGNSQRESVASGAVTS